jgi:ubiquinol-cytochrome c reductase cytochrome b/c1 subunit
MHIIVNLIRSALYNYPVPANLTPLWNFGVISGIVLSVQIITGIVLACYYIPEGSLAFKSIQHIMRDVDLGWLIRYIHLNFASMFFFAVYMHMFRSWYYRSYRYPRELVWVSGVSIYLIMILTAFLGYVLPWGQMSFWAATVITNLASAIPVIGGHIVIWLWGGFAVGNPTLTRFFALHFLFPFLLVAIVLLHITFLHEQGSSNSLELRSKYDRIPFTPYFVTKDFLGLILFYAFFIQFHLFISPNALNEKVNFIPANPLVTPKHIVPEWYFLPFYAILRSVPDKIFGVFLLVFALVCLFVVPFLRVFDVPVISETRPLALGKNFLQWGDHFKNKMFFILEFIIINLNFWLISSFVSLLKLKIDTNFVNVELLKFLRKMLVYFWSFISFTPIYAIFLFFYIIFSSIGLVPILWIVLAYIGGSAVTPSVLEKGQLYTFIFFFSFYVIFCVDFIKSYYYYFVKSNNYFFYKNLYNLLVLRTDFANNHFLLSSGLEEKKSFKMFKIIKVYQQLVVLFYKYLDILRFKKNKKK